jgi:uncharacterized membrane protein (Fun14 family)
MRAALSFVIALVATLGIGALLGIAWESLAPRVDLVVASDGKAYPEGYQPEGYATDDGIAALLCIGAGLVVGIAALWVIRRVVAADLVVGVALAVVVVLGVVGAVTLWWVGEQRGDYDLAAVLATAQEGDVITAPLRLRMPGVLVLWPAASVLVVFIAALNDWLRGRRTTVPA